MLTAIAGRVLIAIVAVILSHVPSLAGHLKYTSMRRVFRHPHSGRSGTIAPYGRGADPLKGRVWSVFLAVAVVLSCPRVPGATAPPTATACVIVLHGLGRTRASMERLGVALRHAGYIALNPGYPSRHAPVETLAENVIPRSLDACRRVGARPVHFVTHSLGGILVRYHLRHHVLPELGQVVMISPPNRGSELADVLKDWTFYRWWNGPAGQQLGTGADALPARLGSVNYPVGVIAGDRHAFFDYGFAHMIPGKDDGKVSVERAKVHGMRDFLVLPYAHPFIMEENEVIEQTLYFLRHGRFRRP